VIFGQLAIWMRNNYKSKYRNPDDPDISISTQHTDKKGFSSTISQENIPINKYSNILKKYKNLKEQRKTQQIPWNEKRCTKNAKISGEIHEKNTQHDMINQYKCSGVRMAKKAKRQIKTCKDRVRM
jgi:hypothetical protein